MSFGENGCSFCRKALAMLLFQFLQIAMIRSSLAVSLRSLEKYGVSLYDSQLASRLCCEIKQGSMLSEETGLILQENVSDGAVELAWGAKSTVKEVPFRIDFASIAAQQRGKMSRSELVSKAAGSKTSHVIDLTAGLGRDSFILASAGYRVCMLERNPVLYYLLSDAINRLYAVNPRLAERMKLMEADSRSVLESKDLGIDFKESDIIAVYLDPMYEGNAVGRRSNVKKETTMLHRLVSDDYEGIEDNSKTLFETAQRLSNSRIIVKRACKATSLANSVPHEMLTGSTQRFDIYFKSRKILMKA